MPASPAPGWDDDPAWLDRDPMTAAEREASLDRLCEQDEGRLEEEDEHGDVEPFTAEEFAEIRQAAADELLAVEAASMGRRGPGQPGSTRVFPGESSSPAAAFGPGMIFDLLPGCAQLAAAADAASEDDRFAGVSEAELVGVMCAWDRVEAHAAARKLAVIAELSRRNPEPEDAEFTADQIACALGESRFRAYELTGTAGHLDTHLPGTRAALRDGIVSLSKARIIVTATGLLDPGEAAAAEQDVLDRAGRLTPGSLRAAIARAVVEAAPGKARKRRKTAEKFARVERWAEDSGNAALAGRELPPDEVLAIDDRITARARELKAAGLEGGTDELRARAYLDLLLGKDSRPGGTPGAAPAGFASRVTLTAPLATLTGLADRPGVLSGLGPVDPWLARDLATAAAHNPKTTWCMTVTDQKGHAVAHGCARPEPRRHRKRAGPGPPRGGTGPSGGPPRPDAPTTPNPPATPSSRRAHRQRTAAVLRFAASHRGGAVMAGPGDERAITHRRGQDGLRASYADREQVIELLKAAFVQDRLTKDELGMRVGRALAARTGAELVALTVDIPAGAGPVRPPMPARRRPLAKAAAWSGGCLAIAGAAVWAAFSRESLAGPMLLLALYAVLAALVISGFGVATSRKQRRFRPDQSRRALTIQL